MHGPHTFKKAFPFILHWHIARCWKAAPDNMNILENSWPDADQGLNCNELQSDFIFYLKEEKRLNSPFLRTESEQAGITVDEGRLYDNVKELMLVTNHCCLTTGKHLICVLQ